MRNKNPVIVIVALVMTVFATSALAFDDTRKGFLIGLSGGGGYQTFSADVSDERQNKFAFGTDFRIGGGINEQFALYFDNRVSWFGVGEEQWTEGDIVAWSVTGLGASYYLEPEAPTVYVQGSIGYSGWAWMDQLNEYGGHGFGFTAGAGYEFSPHAGIDAMLMWGKPEDDVSEYKVDALAILVTVGYTWY
jgi:hypothetical protein